MARKKPSSSSSLIPVGNCKVVVEAKNFTTESDQNSLQISLSRHSKIKISVAEDEPRKDCNDHENANENGNCYFVLVNPKDPDGQLKSLLQEVLALYMKELPSMNFAANTGKKSTFLERCVLHGKFCTLLLKTKSEEGAEEVIAAITFQIIPVDTQYAEVPLAAVGSVYQHKGIGHLIYMEMRKRLQSVGVRSIFCWGDEESERFWLKQGFVSVGEVDTKGRAQRLPIKANIRKALCFPGGSTLMISHLTKDCSSNSEKPLQLSFLLKPLQKSSAASMVQIQGLADIAERHAPPETLDLVTSKTEDSQPEEVMEDSHIRNGCLDLVSLEVAECNNVVNNLQEKENKAIDDARQCTCSSFGGKKRTWEASHTSLKSKNVKGGQLVVCQSNGECVSGTNRSTESCMDVSPFSILGNEPLMDSISPLGGQLSNSYKEKDAQQLGADAANDCGCKSLMLKGNQFRIMLMNIADDAKKSSLTKIIEDLGGSVTSDGKASTHVITGKVRKTLNFCTALCSGAWVISPGWLKQSFLEGRFVDELPYILKDEEYELKYRTDLKQAILRARADPGALLKGYEVCLAPHVQPPLSISDIVRSAGGKVICDLDKVKDSAKAIFVASEENMEEALSAVKNGILTFSSDWFMNCIMRQELDLEAPPFAESL